MTSRPLFSFGGTDVACGAASDLGAEDDLLWDVFPLARLDSRDYVLVVEVGQHSGLVGESIRDAV